MKYLSVALLIFMVALTGCQQDDATELFIETLAMTAGYEMRNHFDWNEGVDNYYLGIMDGKITLDAAKAAEAYLKTRTHPLIANRIVRIAGMVGFTLNDVGEIIGVDKVDIGFLQTAARGFKDGLSLVGPLQQSLFFYPDPRPVYYDNETEYPVFYNVTW